jgi:hypothetical protein
VSSPRTGEHAVCVYSGFGVRAPRTLVDCVAHVTEMAL